MGLMLSNIFWKWDKKKTIAYFPCKSRKNCRRPMRFCMNEIDSKVHILYVITLNFRGPQSGVI